MNSSRRSRADTFGKKQTDERDMTKVIRRFSQRYEWAWKQGIA